ncbi:hypothetical protein ACOSQ4_022281 [Xanthoceras sorbifolium]
MNHIKKRTYQVLEELKFDGNKKLIPQRDFESQVYSLLSLTIGMGDVGKKKAVKHRNHNSKNISSSLHNLLTNHNHDYIDLHSLTLQQLCHHQTPLDLDPHPQLPHLHPFLSNFRSLLLHNHMLCLSPLR